MQSLLNMASVLDVNPIVHRDNQVFYAQMFCVMFPPTLAHVAAALGGGGES